MKYLIICLIMYSSIYSQVLDGKVSDVKDYFNMCETLCHKYGSKQTNNIYKLNQDFSKSEVDILAREIYNIYKFNYLEYKEYLYNAELDYKKGVYYKNPEYNNKIIPSNLHRLISSQLRKQLNYTLYQVITTPFFIKAKILKQVHWDYTSRDTRITNKFSANKMYCLVEDIIKGNGSFKIGDTVKVNFLWHWLNDAKNSFVDGNTYLIPCKLMNCGDSTKPELATYSMDDDNYGIYPIESDEVVMPGNVFELGEQCSWNSFKEEFIKRYIANFEIDN